LEDHRLDPARVPNRDSQAKAIDVLRNQTNKPVGVPSKLGTPVSRDALAAKQPETNEVTPTPEQSSLSDLEKKMDELLRLKAIREAAATNNAASNTATSAPGPVVPKSKRDRLNDLLKLYIDGKIQDAEYKEQRAKLVTEPD